MRSDHTNPRGALIPIPRPLEAPSFLSHINTTEHSEIHDPETRPHHHTSDSVTKTHREPPTHKHTPSHTTSSATTHFKHTVMTLHLTLRPTLDTQSHAALGPRSPAASRPPAASQPRSCRNIRIGLRPHLHPRGSRTGSAHSDSRARSSRSQRLRPPLRDPRGHHGPRLHTWDS